MPRARKLEVVMNDDTEQVESLAPVEEPLPYQLETLNEEAMSQMKVWGNSTQVTINNLATIAPEWGRFLYDFFEMIKAHVREHAE